MNKFRFIRSNPLRLAFQEITHTGRHTFGTTITLANKVSLENVSKMLGHSSTRMTQHYARVLDQNILEDMMNVQKRLSPAPNL